VLDECGVGEAGARLLTHRVDIVRCIGLDRIEVIAAGTGVNGRDDRPGRPVPMLRKRVPDTARVLLSTYFSITYVWPLVYFAVMRNAL
jgi:hypothetical protein